MQQTWWTRHGRMARALCWLAYSPALFACQKDLVIGDVSAPPTAFPDGSLGLQGGAFTFPPELPPPDVTMPMPSPGYVNGVGDLDGDGFQDFAATGVDPATDLQFLHVRYGGPRPTSAEGAVALAESGARLTTGASVNPPITSIVAAGDVNGDGYGDLLVGLTGGPVTIEATGVYLLYGGPQRLSGVHPFEEVAVFLRAPARDASLEPADPGVAALGDFDGDGLDDFVLEARRSPYGSREPSSPPDTAYLFYGRREGFRNASSWLDADARFQAPHDAFPVAPGDVTADGFADLIVSNFGGASIPGNFFIPGRAQRLAGDVDLATTAISLGALTPSQGSFLDSVTISRHDWNGDGIADLILHENSGGRAWLVYGRPALFASGVDVSHSLLMHNDGDHANDVWFAGDRDGDGYAELFSVFQLRLLPTASRAFQVVNSVAFSGSAQGASDRISFPVEAVRASRPNGYFQETYRQLRSITVAGDLDGDGADDLLTTSELEAPPEVQHLQPTPELHIHYGVPHYEAPSIH